MKPRDVELCHAHLSIPKKGLFAMKFKVTGLDQVDSEEFYQVCSNLVFSGPPKSSSYGKLFGLSNSPRGLFCLTTLEKNLVGIEFRTDCLTFEAVLELIAWFRDIDDGALLPEFCLLVKAYRRTRN